MPPVLVPTRAVPFKYPESAWIGELVWTEVGGGGGGYYQHSLMVFEHKHQQEKKCKYQEAQQVNYVCMQSCIS